MEKNFRTSFECPCFPRAETPRLPTNHRAHHGRNYRGNAARFQAIRSPNLAYLSLSLSLWLAPRDNEQWDEQIRIAERLGEDPRKMEFEAFAMQPQKREERKKLFTKRHREPSRKRRVGYRRWEEDGGGGGEE